MTTTCTFRLAPGQPCPTPATHAVLGSGLAADWRAVGAMGATRPWAEFCAAHAEAVADARNAAHQAAKEARALQPRGAAKAHCAVCGAPLGGVRYEVPGVGLCCGPCQAAAASEQMDDARTGPKPKSRRRVKPVASD